jgi:hypothetical protein
MNGARRAALHRRIGRFRVLQPTLQRLFARDLRRFHDVLATTDLAGRYWVWGGLLLGWAREGNLLRADTRDADFAIRSEDLARLDAAVSALTRAGFRRLFRFTNNAGQLTEVTFLRHGSQFEFFLLFPENGMLRYFMYGSDHRGPVEIEAEEPDQPLQPFELAGRSWLKPIDHEAHLACTYGDWRTPVHRWSYLEQPNIVERRTWLNVDHEWPDR